MDYAPAELIAAGNGGLEQMHTVVLLTQAMYSAAQAHEWAVFAELETQRAGALAALFPLRLLSTAQGEEIALRMQQLLVMNQHMVELAEQERQGAELELQQLREGRQALRAYSGVRKSGHNAYGLTPE
ncbi:MAG: flagellar protein FliT [Gammaproteobacteria bacterium]|nr:flagellar protein FliT [Gammaproteobacteria bacterium]